MAQLGARLMPGLCKKRSGLCVPGGWRAGLISGTWQLDGLALLHCHSQNNLKIRNNLLVKAHVLE